MATQWRGHARFRHNPRDVRSLKLIQTSESQRDDALIEANGIVAACPDPTVNVTRSLTIEPMIISASINEGDADEFDRSRHEVFLVVRDGDRHVEENRDYDFSGYVYPHPKSQQSVLLIDEAVPRTSHFDSFSITPQVIDTLYPYVPTRGESVFEKLVDVAADFADSITLIRGRLPLHLLYRTVWHSCLAFMFMRNVVDRGWIEALVMGDTRCGKSVAFKRMAEHYSMGVLIDCKSQTLPGILGTVVQSASGDYYVVAGLMPQQDGRIICFDEFHVP